MISVIDRITYWFNKAKPSPTPRDLQVQIGVHLEEVAEMLDAIKPEPVIRGEFADTIQQIEILAELLKSDPDVIVTVKNRELLLDAICDQIVTATGVSAFLGFQTAAALEEVNASNYSKFVDGKAVFDENGKIAKPDTHWKPDLKSFTNPN